jgi:hypothetical protein
MAAACHIDHIKEYKITKCNTSCLDAPRKNMYIVAQGCKIQRPHLPKTASPLLNFVDSPWYREKAATPNRHSNRSKQKKLLQSRKPRISKRAGYSGISEHERSNSMRQINANHILRIHTDSCTKTRFNLIDIRSYAKIVPEIAIKPPGTEGLIIDTSKKMAYTIRGVKSFKRRKFLLQLCCEYSSSLSSSKDAYISSFSSGGYGLVMALCPADNTIKPFFMHKAPMQRTIRCTE